MRAQLDPVLVATRPLADRFESAGKRIYLVGGIVRDLLAGRPIDWPDIDLTTDAHPEDTKRLISGWADSVWTQGERFGTIGAKKDGRTFEITTHRAEAYTPGSRNPDVVFADAVEVDLSRRDFTVNAMALTLPEPELIDPFDGRTDLLSAKRLRTPLEPELSFTDDPLRMLRAARFVAGYGLIPEPALVDAIKHLAHRLEIVSAERVRDELDKLMVVEDPSTGLWFLHDTGLFAEFLPEIPGLRLATSRRTSRTARPTSSPGWRLCCMTSVSRRRARSGSTA
jgi:poly(A) polymerase